MNELLQQQEKAFELESMENKYLGMFKGEDMYGNEATQECIEWLTATKDRLLKENTEKELELLTRKP